MGFFDFLGRPMGLLINLFYSFFGNFGMSIIAFTIVITMAMIPLDIRQQKSAAGQFRIRPKLDALRKKYPNDKRKYQEEMMDLQRREGISMVGGCSTMLIRMPFLFGIFAAIRNPLSSIAGYSRDYISLAREILAERLDMSYSSVTELYIWRNLDPVTENSPGLAAEIIENVPGLATARDSIDFYFLGLDLSQTPVPEFFNFASWEPSAIWIIPFMCLVFTLGTTIVTMQMNKRNPGMQMGSPMGAPTATPGSAPGGKLMYIMPLISVGFAMAMPGAVGLYWACSSLFGGIVRICVSRAYSPSKVNAKRDFQLIMKRRQEEALIKKRHSIATDN